MELMQVCQEPSERTELLYLKLYDTQIKYCTHKCYKVISKRKKTYMP